MGEGLRRKLNILKDEKPMKTTADLKSRAACSNARLQHIKTTTARLVAGAIIVAGLTSGFGQSVMNRTKDQSVPIGLVEHYRSATVLGCKNIAIAEGLLRPVTVALRPNRNLLTNLICTDQSSHRRVETNELRPSPIGLFSVVSDCGVELISTNGVTWTMRGSDVQKHRRGVAFRAGVFVKVGCGAAIQSSTDGVNWIKRETGIPCSLYAVAYGKGLFVAVANEGAIVTSTNGVTWATQDSGTDERLRGVAFGNGRFAAVGYAGTIVTSKNGVRWSSRNSDTDVRLQDISFGRSTFVAVGWNGMILTSNRGFIWTQRKSGTLSRLNDISYGEGNFLEKGHEIASGSK